MNSTEAPSQRRKGVRRSKLVCMGDNRTQLDAAPTSGADIVQIVLEDGVDDSRKDIALQRTADLVRDADWQGAERWIKVNERASGRLEDDIRTLVAAGADAIIIPKIYSAADVREVAAFIGEQERQSGREAGSVSVVCSIERIRALHNVEEIAACHPSILALQMGLYDLGEEFGYKLDYTGPSYETLYAKSRCVLAAKLAGIEIGDWPYPVANDLAGTERATLWSIQLGFTHKACYQLEQIPVVNRLFDRAAEMSTQNTYISAKAELGQQSD
jgi:citrate lyase beta subunit